MSFYMYMFVYCSFLTNIDGGLKNVSSATQEAADISKFLYLCSPSERDFRNVSHMPNVVAYINKLRDSKVGPSGQITKLSILTNTFNMSVGQMEEMRRTGRLPKLWRQRERLYKIHCRKRASLSEPRRGTCLQGRRATETKYRISQYMRYLLAVCLKIDCNTAIVTQEFLFPL